MSRVAFMRMFSSALASQALLSGTSFGVGLLLIRHTNDLQYGYYILVSSTIILMASLQTSFIAPAMINRMMRLSPEQCGDLTGGLYREQRQLITAVSGLALVVVTGLWLAGIIDTSHLPLLLASLITIIAALRREYFRSVLLAYRRAHAVLRGDLVYALLLVLGVVVAIRTPLPAVATILALALAAMTASVFLSKALRRSEHWNPAGVPGILKTITPVALWSTAGAAIHWSFSQGYTYLVAAMLDVRAVAAIAATRLLAMPVNLLSSGIGSLMLPLASRWMIESGAPRVLRRLIWFALGIGGASLCYFVTLWFLRDWVFDVILHKQFAQRDLLLMLWSAIFVLMAVHQQLHHMLVARQCFRRLTSLALVSAVLAVISSYWAILHFGGAGAPLGILVGESINTIGVVLLCLREASIDDNDQLPLMESVS